MKHQFANQPSLEISCVIPTYNEEGNIGNLIQQLAQKIQELNRSFEIIMVDDGSSDQSVNEAKAYLQSYPIRIIQLSRNFGKEDAMMAGMKTSRGQAVIIIDADMQEPVSTIERFLEHWDAGYEMVYAVRTHREDESKIKELGSNFFYWFLNRMTKQAIPAHARDFRLMDRKVVDAICDLPERNRFMKGLFSWVGFKTKEVKVVINHRQEGISKFNIKQLIGLAITAITSFSDLPLRIWAGIGACISVGSILYAFWIMGKTLIMGISTPGWATLTVAIFFLGGIQILSIGILGEYLARIFAEVKARPGFIISKEWSYLGNEIHNEKDEASLTHI